MNSLSITTLFKVPVCISFHLSIEYSYRHDDVHDTSCCLIRGQVKFV